jgi:3-hydroxybutyryl-CoA dehydratase
VTAAEPLYFEDVDVGQEWHSAGRTLTEADVRAFAALTGDDNPIHLDANFAAATPFRRRIAHGLLGLSVAGGLNAAAMPLRVQALLGLRDWAFHAPIFFGDTIRVRTRVAAKKPRARGRRGALTCHVQVINQAGRVVQEGVSEVLVEGRSAPADSVSRTGMAW